jgi:hypothetical protein
VPESPASKASELTQVFLKKLKEISVIFAHVDGLTETYGPETVC